MPQQELVQGPRNWNQARSISQIPGLTPEEKKELQVSRGHCRANVVPKAHITDYMIHCILVQTMIRYYASQYLRFDLPWKEQPPGAIAKFLKEVRDLPGVYAVLQTHYNVLDCGNFTIPAPLQRRMARGGLHARVYF